MATTLTMSTACNIVDKDIVWIRDPIRSRSSITCVWYEPLVCIEDDIFFEAVIRLRSILKVCGRFATIRIKEVSELHSMHFTIHSCASTYK